jgi:hypothetical protein
MEKRGVRLFHKNLTEVRISRGGGGTESKT